MSDTLPALDPRDLTPTEVWIAFNADETFGIGLTPGQAMGTAFGCGAANFDVNAVQDLMATARLARLEIWATEGELVSFLRKRLGFTEAEIPSTLRIH